MIVRPFSSNHITLFLLMVCSKTDIYSAYFCLSLVFWPFVATIHLFCFEMRHVTGSQTGKSTFIQHCYLLPLYPFCILLHIIQHIVDVNRHWCNLWHVVSVLGHQRLNLWVSKSGHPSVHDYRESDSTISCHTHCTFNSIRK